MSNEGKSLMQAASCSRCAVAVAHPIYGNRVVSSNPKLHAKKSHSRRCGTPAEQWTYRVMQGILTISRNRR